MEAGEFRDVHHNPNIIWEERVSKNGRPYEIGRPKFDSQARLKSRTKRAFTMSVNWPVTNPAAYTQTDISTRDKAAITRFGLLKNSPGSFYAFQLNFTNLEHYDYYFVDDSGDVYERDTCRNGDHWISYDSPAPRINFVKGS